MNQTIPKLEDQAAFQIEVLGHKGVGYTEYRNINGGKFIGINPRKTPTGTTNQDVVRITCLVIDIDLVDSHDGHILDFANTIILAENFKSYVLVSSGRGAHIYVPVDLPLNTDVKGYFEYLRQTYIREGYYIDKIHDLARVIRVWGSKNEKNGQICQIIENNYNGKNTFKLPVFKPVEKANNGQVATGDILNGGRNNTLTSLAGTMRSKGMSEDAIKAALIQENKKRCNPPLPENEVLSIAHSVSRYNPSAKEVQVPKSLSQDSSKYLDRLLARKAGYSTGFTKLDSMLAGLQPGRMYVLAARTNQGKTSFACNITYNLLTQNVSVLYFPTELGYEPLFDKIVAQRTKLPLKLFQFGNFTDSERELVRSGLEDLSKAPFTVHEDFALTLERIRQRVEEIKPQVIIIDFIQAMKYYEGSPSEIAANVRGIKEIAEATKTPVILASQLNRIAVNNEINLSQLKGSGSIEEFADVVLALHTVNGNLNPKVVDLHILKNRYSELGKNRLNFYSEFGKFEEQN